MTKASVGEHPKADGRPDNIHEEEDERDARLRLGRGEGDMVRRESDLSAEPAHGPYPFRWVLRNSQQAFEAERRESEAQIQQPPGHTKKKSSIN